MCAVTWQGRRQWTRKIPCIPSVLTPTSHKHLQGPCRARNCVPWAGLGSLAMQRAWCPAAGISPCSQERHLLSYCSCSITLTTLKGGTWFPEIPLRLSHCLSLLPRNRQWEWVCEGMNERKQEKQSEKCICGKGAVFRLSPPKLQKYDAHMDNY